MNEITEINEMTEIEIQKEYERLQAEYEQMRNELLYKQKLKAKKARTYIDLAEGEADRIKLLIKQSEYHTVKVFAEKVLMIHKVSLSRKLVGLRRFHYYEILLIEQALETKINTVNVLVGEDN